MTKNILIAISSVITLFSIRLALIKNVETKREVLETTHIRKEVEKLKETFKKLTRKAEKAVAETTHAQILTEKCRMEAEETKNQIQSIK